MGVSAANTGNNLLYIIVSGMLGIMGISGFFGRLNISGISIETTFPEEIYAKEPFLLKITIKNCKKLPSFAIGLEIEKNKKSTAIIEGKSQKEIVITLIAPNRGKHQLKEIKVFSPFPFAFFTRSYTVEKKQTFLVFPKPIKCFYPLKEAEVVGEQFQSGSKGWEGELVNIREYQFEDPLKIIHWKVSAKRGELMVKEFSSPAAESFFVNFDDLQYDLEKKLSCLSYLINYAYSRGIPFGLKLKDKVFLPEITKSHKLKLLKELALFGYEK